MFRIDDEFSLLENLRKGSANAFKELYVEYFEKLCRYINSYTYDENASKDVVQQVMTKIWNGKNTFFVKSSLQNYLYKACYNEFVSTQKHTGKNTILDEQDFFADEPEDDFSEEYIENLKKLRAEIEKLPPKCKEAFTLNKFHGLKYKEVAERLGISIKTVEIHISTAMKRLKEAGKN